MTVREFRNILGQADQDLTIVFEWDMGYSNPEIPPDIDGDFLVFHVGSYNSASKP